MSAQIEELNAKFAIDGQVQFSAGEGGQPKVRIVNDLATAEIYLQGAHITDFQPVGHGSVLWMSSAAQFLPGKAIRGGVPVIWPWFGPHATDTSKPQHGFARTLPWQVGATHALGDGSTRLEFQLTDNPETRVLWPHAFELKLAVMVGTELQIELTSRNTSEQSVIVGGALHSYFAIGDVSKMLIEGLDGRKYIDQLDGDRVNQQQDDVSITQEVDRIYVDSEDTCVIRDMALSRNISVQKTGSRTTVVWNPWQDKARAMDDFTNDGYEQMVCIEAANAVDDVVQLAPGDTHTLGQIITVSSKR